MTIRCPGNQFFCGGAHAVGTAGRPMEGEADIAAFSPSECCERLPEHSQAELRLWIIFGVWHQQTNAPHPLPLLRPRREIHIARAPG